MKISIDKIKEMWAQYSGVDDWLAVYIHSPFCLKVCNFCAYKGSIYDESKFKQYYNHELPKMIAEYRSLLEGKVPDAFYFGGGTPSLMDIEMMENIFNSIPNFKKVENKYFEAHPGTLSEGKLELLKSFNFRTIIFGIQSFDDESIKKSNRYAQPYSKVRLLVKLAKKLGLKVGADILLWQQNTNIYDDLMIADELEFDVIFAAIDYEIKRFSMYLNKFTSDVYSLLENNNYFTKDLPIEDYIKIMNNITIYREDIEPGSKAILSKTGYDVKRMGEGVFEYCTFPFNKYESIVRGMSTLAIGSDFTGHNPVISNMSNDYKYFRAVDGHIELKRVKPGFKYIDVEAQ